MAHPNPESAICSTLSRSADSCLLPLLLPPQTVPILRNSDTQKESLEKLLAERGPPKVSLRRVTSAKVASRQQSGIKTQSAWRAGKLQALSDFPVSFCGFIL